MSDKERLEIESSETAQKRTRKMIQEGWILLLGDGVEVEERFYKPGTKANADFILAFGPSPEGLEPKMLAFFLFKPNKEWNEYIKEVSAKEGEVVNPEDIVIVAVPNEKPSLNFATFPTLEEANLDRLESVRMWLDHLNICTAYKNGIVGPTTGASK